MVYSGWLFLTVIFSMGLGYFLFGHISMKINMESIQAQTTKVTCSPVCPENGTGESSKINLIISSNRINALIDEKIELIFFFLFRFNSQQNLNYTMSKYFESC